MADADCISTCAVCAGDMVQPARGRKRRYCSAACRTRAASKSFQGIALAKPGRKKRLELWLCSQCGIEKLLRPCEAKARQFCSAECRAAARRLEVHGPFICKGCHSAYYRKRLRDDAGEYCSRKCFFQTLDRVAKECRAIRRIGDRRRMMARKASAQRFRAVVLPEIQALRRIASRSHQPILISVQCQSCMKEMMTARDGRKRRSFCRDCRGDSVRAQRRTDKSRRRARLRGVASDRIDPLKVFERDGWRCHLCGVKTPKSLRGKHLDRSPELEHIVSLADGGSHTWGNVACSCRRCNQEKGAGSRGQLGLAI